MQSIRWGMLPRSEHIMIYSVASTANQIKLISYREGNIYQQGTEEKLKNRIEWENSNTQVRRGTSCTY